LYRQETTKLRMITRSTTFRMILTDHAEERMAEYDVARFEIERVLKAGAVVMLDMEPSGTETWRVAGRDADGRRIEVVVEPIPPSMMVVITVIRVS
jgi:Domain of unknown function (DUF4258)